jgi:3-oxoacyl-[acyl-carrier protein] reductase
MDLGLKGKVALVTGASGGIGAGIATELAREGVDLCLMGRDRNKLDQAAGAIAEISGRRPAVHVGDLREPDASVAAIAAAVAALGRLDIVVNCAGDTKRGDFLKLSEEDWLGGFSTKFHGTVRMTRAAWPHLRQTNGVVINIVGIGSRAGSAEFAIGGAVNVALLNFTKAMADLGIREGVRVNAINPGLIETDRLARNIERVMGEHSCSRDEAVARLLAPRGTTRFGSPQEIGWLAAFLASPKAAFIHGAIVDIDGGSTRAL